MIHYIDFNYMYNNVSFRIYDENVESFLDIIWNWKIIENLKTFYFERL